MTLGNWTPDKLAPKSASIMTIDIAHKFINLATNDLLDELYEHLSQQEIQLYAVLMLEAVEDWQAITGPLSDQELVLLIKFFTKAEQLPGWEAGAHSPVIGLGKLLKKRGGGITKDLAIWIKANSDNRFLPHGSLL